MTMPWMTEEEVAREGITAEGSKVRFDIPEGYARHTAVAAVGRMLRARAGGDCGLVHAPPKTGRAKRRFSRGRP